jgi:hypothetical protein
VLVKVDDVGMEELLLDKSVVQWTTDLSHALKKSSHGKPLNERGFPLGSNTN